MGYPGFLQLGEIRAAHYRSAPAPLSLVVIHTGETNESSTAAEGIANYFASGNTIGSAQVCVDDDSAVRCVPGWDYTTNGAGGVNARAFHIEIAGRANQTGPDWTDAFSRKALERAAFYAAEACDHFGIPKWKVEADGKGVCGHDDVSQQHASSAGHYDPGAAFPWREFMQMVNGTPTSSIDFKAIRRRMALIIRLQEEEENMATIITVKDSGVVLDKGFDLDPLDAKALDRVTKSPGAVGLLYEDMSRDEYVKFRDARKARGAYVG